jgi:hypothetical protein
MLTVQTVENINQGSRITLANGVYAIILGLINLVLLIPLLKFNFKQIDVVWEIFSRYNPELSRMFLGLVIFKALLIVSAGIIIFYLSNFILKKKDKAAWVILFVVGLLLWATMLTLDILSKNIYSIVLSLIGWLSFIIGMLIPIKYYLRKEYPDY